LLIAGSDLSTLKIKVNASDLPGSIRTIPRKKIALVLLCAFVLNAIALIVVLPLSAHLLAHNYSLSFQDLYDLIGNNVASGNGYRVEPGMATTMVREPGYPLLLALVFKFAGYHIEAARILNLFLAFGSGILLFALTRKITDDEKVALTSTLLFLFYPGTWVAEARGGVEIVFTFSILLFMVSLYRAMETNKSSSYFVAGLLIGISVLIRSEVLFFPVFVCGYLLLSSSGSRNRMQIVQHTIAIIIGLVLAISPWTVRNYLLVKKVVPTASVSGMAIQEGLYTCEHLSSQKGFAEVQNEAGKQRAELATQLGRPFVGSYYYQLFYEPNDELIFSKLLTTQTVTEYRREPQLLLECGGRNLLFNFWFLGKTWQATKLNLLVQLPLITLAVIGMAMLRRRGLLDRAGLIIAFLLYVPLVHAPIIAHARHSMVILPMLSIFSCVALVAFWEDCKSVRFAPSSSHSVR
jgi:4-amino-4-deoxy-L-arabinose transferase-like glycosyltransferase